MKIIEEINKDVFGIEFNEYYTDIIEEVLNEADLRKDLGKLIYELKKMLEEKPEEMEKWLVTTDKLKSIHGEVFTPL